MARLCFRDSISRARPLLAGATALTLVSGCSLMPEQASELEVTSFPNGARAEAPSGEWCMTPCTLDLADAVGDVVRIHMSGVGFKSGQVTVTRNRFGGFAPNPLIVRMELSAPPADGVSATPLPAPEDG